MRERATDRSPPPHMIQLPSNFLLPLWLHFSKCSERNVPQIRVSARWGGWETGKRREGRETERKTNSSQFTQAKHLLAHLCIGFITILWILQTASRLVSGHGHTHTHTKIDRDRRYHSAVTRWDYSKRVCRSLLKTSVSVAVKYPHPTELSM